MEFCHGILGEPEQRHGEADSTNGCKDKWKNVDAWESHRQWKRMKERVQHVDRSLTMGNTAGFISSHASTQQIAYSYSPITLGVMPYYVTLCWIGVDCGCRSLTGAEINPTDIFAGEKLKVEISSLCKLKPSQMQHSQSQDLSEEEEGSMLAWCCRTGPESWRGSRPQPQKHSIAPAGTGNSHLSQRGLARPSSPAPHKYLHDMCWHARSYHKSFKLIIAH